MRLSKTIFLSAPIAKHEDSEGEVSYGGLVSLAEAGVPVVATAYWYRTLRNKDRTLRR